MEKKRNKGLIFLVVILFIWCLGLTGFIVYDKVLLNDNKEISNNIEDTTNESEEKKEEVKNIEDNEKYFKVDSFNKKVNGKDVKVSFCYFLTDIQEEVLTNDGPQTTKNGVSYEIAINDKVVENSENQITYNVYDDIEKLKRDIKSFSDKNIKILQGKDKDYIVIDIERSIINSQEILVYGEVYGFVITNTEAENIYKVDFSTISGWYNKDENSKFKVGENETEYIIEDNEIYYMYADCGNEYVNDGTMNLIEYKVTVNNDKVVSSEVDRYTGGGTGAGNFECK